MECDHEQTSSVEPCLTVPSGGCSQGHDPECIDWLPSGWPFTIPAHERVMWCVDRDGSSQCERGVAFRYKGKWLSPDYFLRVDARNGIYTLPSVALAPGAEAKRPAFAYLALLRLMMDLHSRAVRRTVWGGEDDPPAFLWPDPAITTAKLCVFQGQMAGYYTYTEQTTVQPYPVMRHLYVRQEWRGCGLATQMVRDFMSSFSGQIEIESPSDATRSLLSKANLLGVWGSYGRGRDAFRVSTQPHRD